jgi:hypothetical protein
MMKKEVIVGVGTFFLAVFWIVAKHVNVYHYAVIGAIFEILWLPMLLVLAIMPGLSFYFWRGEHWRFTSLYPYCLLVNVTTIAVLVFYQ